MRIKSMVKVATLLILIIVIIFVAVHTRSQFSIEALQKYLTDLGSGYAPFIFMGIYAVATVVFLPGAVITLVGGLVFGPWWGTVYNLVGACVGASISFLIARFIAADWVQEKAGGKAKMLIDGVDETGWRFVAIVRLMPILPFNLLNYALGLTRISFISYLLASFLFMAPGCFAYTYLGSLGKAAIHGEGKALLGKVFIAIGLLIFVSCIPWLLKRFKQTPQREASDE